MNKKKHKNKISKQALSIGAIAAIASAPTSLNAEQVETSTTEKGQEMAESSKTKASIDYAHFEDPKLQAAINAELGQADDAKITVSQMESFRSLSLANKGITDDYGLQYATNLIDLDLSGNELTRYSNVAELPNLETVNLSNNKLTAVNTTKKSPSIKNINLSNNEIVFLSDNDYNLNNGTLDLSNNKIYLVSDNLIINNCSELNLEGNSINDFSHFAATSKNTKINFNNQSLTLEDFQVTDDDPVYTMVTTLQGETINVNLGVPKFGTFEYSLPKELEIDTVNKVKTTITFNGKVTYEGFLTESTAESNIGKPLSDEELLDLFKVTGSYADGTEMKVNVDQSEVNYERAGVYTVHFTSTASNGDEISRSATLTIKDTEASKDTTKEEDSSNEVTNTTTTDTTTPEETSEDATEDATVAESSRSSEDTTIDDTSESTNTAESQTNSEEAENTKDNNDEAEKTLADTGITTNTGIILGIGASLASLLYLRSKQK